MTKFLDKGTHDKACGMLNLSRREEISVSSAIFAFRCEVDEDRVVDQEKRMKKNRVIDQSTIAPELVSKEPGHYSTPINEVGGHGLSGSFWMVESVRFCSKMDVSLMTHSATIFCSSSVARRCSREARDMQSGSGSTRGSLAVRPTRMKWPTKELIRELYKEETKIEWQDKVVVPHYFSDLQRVIA